MPEMPKIATWHLPVADLETRQYWDGTREGKLLIKECRSCGNAFFYPRNHCPTCWSTDTVWRESSGRGTVYTFTVVYQNDLPPFRDRVPYVVAIVELEEGVRMPTNLIGVEPDPRSIRVGMPVIVKFKAVSEQIAIPVFEPLAAE